MIASPHQAGLRSITRILSRRCQVIYSATAGTKKPWLTFSSVLHCSTRCRSTGKYTATRRAENHATAAHEIDGAVAAGGRPGSCSATDAIKLIISAYNWPDEEN